VAWKERRLKKDCYAERTLWLGLQGQAGREPELRSHERGGTSSHLLKGVIGFLCPGKDCP